MCGHRLHGRTISTSGISAWTLSAIEHSVIIATRLGRLLRTQLIMCAVEPVKSASARTSGGHSGWAMILTVGSASRRLRNSSPVKRSCTSQAPFHAMISTFVLEATYFARYWSGRKITFGALRLSTTSIALDEVQQISTSAFTSADVLT